ncbi:MAG TPA: hypothetical protein DCQ50_10880 [Chryseobacterium sp.]|nr:hypothetical protein [Chryseobacterium sp.]
MKTQVYFPQLHLLKKLFFFLVVIMFSNKINAQNFTFTGNGDGTTWTDPGNWNTNSVPYLDDFSCDVNIGSQYTVTIPSGVTLKRESGAFIGNSTTPPTIINNGTIDFDSQANSHFSGLIIQNNSIINFKKSVSSSVLFYFYRITLNNSLQGTININGVDLQNNGGTNPINNLGKILKSGSGDATIFTHFTNDGEIEVTEGNLSLSGTNTLRTGIFNISTGTSLNINSSNTTISGNWSGTVNGSFDIRGNLTISTSTSVVNNLDGNGLTMHSNMIFGGGTFTNNKLFNINTDTANKRLSGITFENNGILNFGDGTYFTTRIDISNCTFVNKPTGVVHLKGTNFNYDWGTNSINNQGLIKKEGTFAETLDIPVTNSGIIESTGGNFNFASNLNNTNTGKIIGENLQFLPNGYFVNNGSVSPGLNTGTMTVAGYFEMVNGILEIDIDGNTIYDVLNYSGTRAQNISGIIKINLSYAPIVNQEFSIYNSPSATITTNLPSSVYSDFEGFRYHFDVISNANSITLKVREIALATTSTEISSEFSVYPNPVVDHLNYSLTSSPQKYSVFSLDGRLLLSGELKEKNGSISLSKISKGNYLLIINTEIGILRKKIIKK